MFKYGKRACALLLCLCLTATLLVLPALAAGSVNWTVDTTLTRKQNRFTDAVIGAGVTVTLRDSGNPAEPTGLEITGSLTVEPGGALAGNGILILYPEARVTGLELYYRAGGERRLLDGGTDTHWASGVIPGDYWAQFRPDPADGAWCLAMEFQGDPFDQSKDSTGQVPPGNNHDLRNAQRLHSLGLLRGSGTLPDGSPDFELERPASRVEALVMLIRLLGREEEALAGTWTHPFTDVPAWAEPYAGFAYENGLTRGVSETLLGGDSEATRQMYLTFVLRALGYFDAQGDFSWQAPEVLAQQLGLINDSPAPQVFLRGDMATISAYALRAAQKEDGRPLCESLIERGVFSRPDYDSAIAGL